MFSLHCKNVFSSENLVIAIFHTSANYLNNVMYEQHYCDKKSEINIIFYGILTIEGPYC